MESTQMMALLTNQFLYYNEDELALEVEFYTHKIIANPRCSTQQRKKGTQDLQDVYAMLELFDMFKNLGLDTSGETGATMLQKMSGRTVGELKSSLGTTAYLTVREGAMKAFGASKKGTNRFANWLAGKTE